MQLSLDKGLRKKKNEGIWEEALQDPPKKKQVVDVCIYFKWMLILQWKAEWEHDSKRIVQSLVCVCVCVVNVFLSGWVEVDVAAQLQQWFHSSTANVPFLQTATARYYLNAKLPWENTCIERGTPQIHYEVLLGQIWMNSDIHFGSTIISHT